jgi:hypothetical protein
LSSVVIRQNSGPREINNMAAAACQWRITKITQQSVFGISLDNASAIDNN